MNESLPRDQFPPEFTIFEYGESGDSAYIVESGNVRVMSYDNRCLAVLGPGSLFGEVALLDHQARTATVITISECTLIRIDRAHIEELLLRTDPVIRFVLNLLLERFRSNYKGMASAAQSEPNGDQHRALRTLTLTRDLTYALDHDKPSLFYQPIVDCKTRRLRGFESLIRWRHPTLGLIMPDEFIGLAEKTGLIRALGRWVYKRALADWAGLRRYCCPSLGTAFISINLSADELRDPQVAEDILKELHLRHVPPNELKIELTETVLIEDHATVASTLHRLAEEGVGIALDDFGTGYGGLEYLRRLPFSSLKIDKSFVGDMLKSSVSAELVGSALHLADSLGMSSIAEGVETAEVLESLQALGCQLLQGYYFSPALPLADIPAWVDLASSEGRIVTV